MAWPKMEHITTKERGLTTVLVFAIYFVVVFSISSTNVLMYILLCIGIMIALSKIQKHFLLYLNERRCKALETKSDISSDDDSNER